MTHNSNIRSSTLPIYADCPRRSASKINRKELEAAGYVFRELPPSIGSAIGTAAHLVGESVLRAKIETGALGDLDAGLELALAAFDVEIEPGAIWDDTTKNRNAAQIQIKNLARAYYHGVAKHVDPLAVELYLEADTGDGVLLTGNIDLVTVAGSVRDLKTGAVDRDYFAQLGGYGLLCRSQPEPLLVTGLGIDWLKRTGHTKPQPPVIKKEYPLAACQQLALDVIGSIKRDLAEFRATGNPAAFMCNTGSMMCSDKYCPAWGTDFCAITKAAA